MEIRIAWREDLPVLAELAVLMWEEHTATEMEAEFAGIMEQGEAVFFLAFEEERAVGFAQCQLRRDYVEGTETSPVGYLEGIFVAEAYRQRGIARKLLHTCESWARDQGCREFASDCELGNTGSLAFHLNMGFQEANRIICFTKELG